MKHKIIGVLVLGLVACVAGCAQPGKARELVVQLNSSDMSEKASAEIALVDMGPTAIPELRRAAQAPEAYDRFQIIGILTEIGKRDADARDRVVKVLLRLLGTTEGADEDRALLGLKELGVASVPGLVKFGIDVGEEEGIKALAVACLIDKDATIDELIRTLKTRHGVRPVVVGLLRSLTKNNFGFDPKAPAVARAQAVRRWIGWWKSRQPAEAGP